MNWYRRVSFLKRQHAAHRVSSSLISCKLRKVFVDLRFLLLRRRDIRTAAETLSSKTLLNLERNVWKHWFKRCEDRRAVLTKSCLVVRKARRHRILVQTWECWWAAAFSHSSRVGVDYFQFVESFTSTSTVKNVVSVLATPPRPRVEVESDWWADLDSSSLSADDQSVGIDVFGESFWGDLQTDSDQFKMKVGSFHVRLRAVLWRWRRFTNRKHQLHNLISKLTKLRRLSSLRRVFSSIYSIWTRKLIASVACGERCIVEVSEISNVVSLSTLQLYSSFIALLL